MKGEWNTPQEIFSELDKEFRFNLDPCNPPVSEEFLPLDNGLLDEWFGGDTGYPNYEKYDKCRAFINPDYKKTERWILKAYKEIMQGRCELAVFLLPSRTDTEWFDFVVNKGCEIRKIKGRLKFGDATEGAPFPSIVVIMRRENVK